MINCKEIKAEAKAKIKGNKWNLIWPLLVISLVFNIIDSTVAKIAGIDPLTQFSDILISGSSEIIIPDNPIWYTIFNDILVLIESVFLFAYTKYLLNFVRTGKAEFEDIINFLKENWQRTFLVSILSTLFISLGFVVLVIPGIIIALGLEMCRGILVDTKDKPMDVIKNSWNLMKGHKWEFFIFILSFIGWFLLIPLTLGIILIWLVPLMNVSIALYYDKLKEIAQK